MTISRLLCLLTLLGIVGCGKTKQAAAPPDASPAAPAPESSSPPPASPPLPNAALVLTQEQEGAVVLVRVSVASLPPREHTGVVMNPGVFTPPVSADSPRRFIAVHLPAYDEQALRNPRCLIHVLRKKYDASGASYIMQYKGALAHFDALTHSAIVQTTEDFSWQLDKGFSPGAAASADYFLLQSVCETPPVILPAPPPSASPLPGVPPYLQQQLKFFQSMLGRPLPEMQRQKLLKDIQNIEAQLQQFQQSPQGRAMAEAAAKAQEEAKAQAKLRAEALARAESLALEHHWPVAELPPASSRGMASRGMAEVRLVPVHLQDGKLTAAAPSEPGPGWKNPVAVLSGDGLLVGFASRNQGQQSWQFQPFSVPPAVEEQWLRFVPQSVQFRSDPNEYMRNLGNYEMTVKGEFQDPLQEYKSCKIVVQNLPAADFTPAADPRVDQPALNDDRQSFLGTLSPDGSVAVRTKIPDGATSAYQVVQVILTNANREEAFHSAPFLVVTQRRGAAMYHTVQGLAAQAGSSPAASSKAPPPASGMASASPAISVSADASAPASGAAPLVPALSRELTTESRILYGVPVCEGREVLFKLEGTPFWKRLSLTDGKWLPLPPEDLGSCHLAGNKEALFVLHPQKREIKRYNAATLALEKAALLPEGISYQGLAAGCLSASAPLAVVENRGAMACDPRGLTVQPVLQLQKRSGAQDIMMENRYYYIASGDAGRVWACPLEKPGPGRSEMAPPVFPYLEDLHGYGTRWAHDAADGSIPIDPYSSFAVKPVKTLGSLPMVAASFAWQPGLTRPGTEETTHQLLFKQVAPQHGKRVMGSLASSPCLYVVSQEVFDENRAVPHPPRCTLYSYDSEVPWAVVDVPEAGELPEKDWESWKRRVWFDPTSLTLALWHHDQTITLHTLDKSKIPPPQTPVLLNYPDGYVLRGQSFHFSPLILGGTAQLTAAGAPAGLAQGADGALDWHVPAAALSRQVTFALKLTGTQQPCEVKIQLQLGGESSVVAMPATTDAVAAGKLIAQGGTGDAELPLVPLKSRVYKTDNPIMRIEAGLTDHLVLRMTDKSLDIFSLKDWKVVASRKLRDTTFAFTAGDVIFIYDASTRQLTRHALPDFTLTGRFQMPGTARLYALGVGVHPSGPLTVLIEEKVLINQPGYSPTATAMECFALVLDKQTLSVGKWAPYHGERKPGQDRYIIGDLVHRLRETPGQIPCSDDGRLLSFPMGLVMISPTLSVDFNYSKHPIEVVRANLGKDWAIDPLPSPATIASPAGGRVFWNGSVFFNNYPSITIGSLRDDLVASRCGNYVARLKTESDSRQSLRLFSAEDGSPLLNLDGLNVLKIQDGQVDDKRQQLCLMGDKNQVAVLSQSGKLLQIVELDLASAFRTLNPGSAYVTSHPFPIVGAGRVLSYQVTVNNPAIVASYELRDPVSGASIDAQGLFTYHAPAALGESQQIKAAILIHLKNGETLTHQFPIYTIALKPEASANRPGR